MHPTIADRKNRCAKDMLGELMLLISAFLPRKHGSKRRNAKALQHTWLRKVWQARKSLLRALHCSGGHILGNSSAGSSWYWKGNLWFEFVEPIDQLQRKPPKPEIGQKHYPQHPNSPTTGDRKKYTENIRKIPPEFVFSFSGEYLEVHFGK